MWKMATGLSYRQDESVNEDDIGEFREYNIRDM